jgi:hypothetical protein
MAIVVVVCLPLDCCALFEQHLCLLYTINAVSKQRTNKGQHEHTDVVCAIDDSTSVSSI